MTEDDIFKDDDLTPEDEEFILADWEDEDDDLVVDFDSDVAESSDAAVLDFDEAVEMVVPDEAPRLSISGDADGPADGPADALRGAADWEDPQLVEASADGPNLGGDFADDDEPFDEDDPMYRPKEAVEEWQAGDEWGAEDDEPNLDQAAAPAAAVGANPPVDGKSILAEDLEQTALDGDEWGDEVEVPDLQDELPDAGWLEDAEPEVSGDDNDLSDASLGSRSAEVASGDTPEAFIFGAPATGASVDVDDIDLGDDEIAASRRVVAAEEDTLFVAEDTERPAAFDGTEARGFTESGGPEWAGDDLDLKDAVGDMTGTTIPTEREEDAIHFDINADANELTLVDAEDDLESDGGFVSKAEESSTTYGYDEDQGDEFDAEGEFVDEPEIDYSHKDFQASEDVEEEWAPVEERDDDDEEDYDDEEQPAEQAAPAPRFGQPAEEPDYSDYEESYYDETDEGYQDDVPQRSKWRWVAALAAVLVLAAAAGIWFLKPEWLGQDVVERVVQVVPIERPKTVMDLEVPSLTPKADPVQVDPKDPVKVDPKDPVKVDPKDPGQVDPKDPGQVDPKDPGQVDPKDPGQVDPKDPGQVDPKDPGQVDPKDPGQVDPKDPGQVDPKDPGQVDPKDPGQVIVKQDPTDPGTTDPEPTDPEQGDPMAQSTTDPEDNIVLDENGSYLGGKIESEEMRRHREEIVNHHNGLVMGSQALAQMFNDSIFVGTVKMLNADFVTLKMKGGELTLSRRQLRTLTPLGTGEAQMWKKAAATGFVKLRNNNRLKGRIVESRDDSVVLQVASNRVVVPMNSIEEVTEASGTSVQMRENAKVETDDWFRRMVERTMAERRSATSSRAGTAPKKPKVRVSAQPTK